MRVVPRTLTEAMVVVDQAPVLSAIIRPIQTAFIGFDECVNAIRFGRDRQSDAPENACRKPVAFDLCPRRATVGGAINSAARSAAHHRIRCAIRLPQRSVQNARIRRIEDHIDRAGLVIFVENFLPGLAAICRAKHSPLGVRSICVPQRRDENNVGILRMDGESSDMARVFQADKVPCFSRIGTLVHAVALQDVVANAGLTCPHIHDVRIGFGNGDRAY